MTTIRRLPVVALVLVLMSALLGGCNRNPGSGNGSGGIPTPTSTSAPATTAPTSSAPTKTTAPTTKPPTAGPSTVVVTARVAYAWNWPNDTGRPGVVTHPRTVPPLVELVRIGAGRHPNDPGERPFDRMSFTFAGGFPSYRFEFTEQLISDGRGDRVPLRGLGVLRIVFTDARAHTADGTRSTIVSQPGRNLGMTRMVDYAAAGDTEGHVTYGIGITWPIPHSNPQIQVRAYEVGRVTAGGNHEYVVAIDVDAR